MDTDAFWKLASPAIVPVVTALVALIKDRLERRQEPEALKTAAARVAFWKSYLEAQTLVLPESDLAEVRQLVATEVGGAAEVVRRSQVATILRAVPFERPHPTFRQLLFFYRPPSPWLWVLRGSFYYYFAYSILAIPILAWRWSTGQNTAGATDLAILFGLLVWVSLLWRLSRYMEDAISSRARVRKELTQSL